MIVVSSKAMEVRLEKAWHNLMVAEERRRERSMSQLEADEARVRQLEMLPEVLILLRRAHPTVQDINLYEQIERVLETLGMNP